MMYPLPRVPARPIPILMYHRCPKDSLKQHLQWLSDNEYTPVHLSEVKGYLINPQPDTFPAGNLVLTFDDALKDFFDNAYPLLRDEFNFPATVCVPTNYISDNGEQRKTTEWDNAENPKAPTMTLDELRELAGNSLFEIIPHSVSHVSFIGEPDHIENNEDKLRSEIGGSKATLKEKLKLKTVEFFCFPYGAGWGKEKPERVLEEQDYVGALRAEYYGEGWNRYCIPRWDVCPLTIGSVLKAISGCS